LAPALLNTGVEHEVALFAYLALLNGALLWLALARDWRTLPISFVFTLYYFWSWYGNYYESSRLFTTLLFATVFFVEFNAVPITRAATTGDLYDEQAGLVAFNAVWYTIALQQLLFEDHRWVLTFAVVALAIGHLAVAQLVARRPSAGRALARMLFAGLALAFITLAIPVRLHGQWLTIGWTLEATVLIWTGLRTQLIWLRAAGLGLFTVVFVRLLLFPIEGGALFLNQRFATFAVVVACYAIAGRLAVIFKQKLQPSEETIFKAVGVAANVLSLWALSAEVSNAPLQVERQPFVLTVIWVAYGVALLSVGLMRHSAILRWQSLVLFGASFVKVFFYDIPSLPLGLRILSCAALGIVLMASSFLYQRHQRVIDHGTDI